MYIRLVMDNNFVLDPDIYVYAQDCPKGVIPLAQFYEKEGFSYVSPQVKAKGLSSTFPCRCIQLEVTTALDAVGITAKVSGILAAANIPCNAIAAYHHDYFLVPLALGEKALELLKSRLPQD
jgi:hypothetical protein